MVRDPRMVDQAAELRHEARMYEVLQNSACASVVPEFYGFSERFGVPLLCVAAEGDDFEDIGLENLSSSLKLSAVTALQRISDCGVLHGDLALRNIVRSRQHPDCAKFIDFGRAQTTKNPALLDAQVAALKTMLGVGPGAHCVVASHKVRRFPAVLASFQFSFTPLSLTRKHAYFFSRQRHSIPRRLDPTKRPHRATNGATTWCGCPATQSTLLFHAHMRDGCRFPSCSVWHHC